MCFLTGTTLLLRIHFASSDVNVFHQIKGASRTFTKVLFLFHEAQGNKQDLEILYLYGQSISVIVNKQKCLCTSDSGVWNFPPSDLLGTCSINGLLEVHNPSLIFTIWGS